MQRIIKLLVKGEEQIQINTWQKLINITLISILFAAFLVFSFISIEYNLRMETIWQYRSKFISGFLLTIVIAFFSLILSLAIGIILAFASKSRFLPLYYFSKIYVEIIRSTPLLVQIYVFFYIIGTALKFENRYVMGVIILSIFSGAYICEIIRAGIDSIDNIQIETARSLGFTFFQRYRLIIIPQVIRRILPPLAGQLASLIKDSSLLSIIAVSELTRNVQEVDAINFAVFENYIVLTILYMLLTVPVLSISRRLETKFNYET
ncbi:MAG: amino acid ABC transporter permease [Syntrophomonadaceae bacterium]|nr:amino acid ABC transporter permease [Syntrophomonadaceae bacterium]